MELSFAVTSSTLSHESLLLKLQAYVPLILKINVWRKQMALWDIANPIGNHYWEVSTSLGDKYLGSFHLRPTIQASI